MSKKRKPRSVWVWMGKGELSLEKMELSRPEPHWMLGYKAKGCLPCVTGYVEFREVLPPKKRRAVKR